MSACIYYHPEAYSTSGEKLMGRNAAGESFLRGFLAYSSQNSELWAYSQSTKHLEDFSSKAQQFNRAETTRAVTNSNLGDLAEPGTLFVPGPGLAEHARNRRLYGDSSWSICGITHTTSSAGAMDSISQFITEPIQPWDTLICTSTAVKKNVEKVLQAQAQEIEQRLGLARLVLPELPVIPLGIHTQDFTYSLSQKEEARTRLGIDSSSVVFLYVGRLSFHAKAHPIAMYTALEEAHKKTGQKVVLVECGWFANDFIEESFKEVQTQLCPSIEVVRLDGRDKQLRDTAWCAADVFCSLSDNIQETFGITPIEAMAAGLPVVVSDWDGYKDTVRDGIDGFRIRTLMASEGLAGDLAHRHALQTDTYDRYCGYASMLISVDISDCARAFSELIQQPELRKRMGEAGRERAQTIYDWQVIIPIYEETWDNQAEKRKSFETIKSSKGVQRLPSRLDPTISFAHYATANLQQSTRIRTRDANISEARMTLEKILELKSVSYAQLVLPTKIEMEKILELAVDSGATVEKLLAQFPVQRKPYISRGLISMIKLGLLAEI
ncbi:glycosyltransferase family 4 protein [Gammaproteobacteria bacterium]|nr:glycosyltransferase family 4 protein [Gammaproteobacteria bacterium]